MYVANTHGICPKTQEPLMPYGVLTQSEKIKEYLISIGFDGKFPEQGANASESPEIDEMMMLGLGYIENISLSRWNISYGPIAVRSIIDDFSSYFGINRASVILPSECLNYFKATEDDLSFSITNFPIVNTKNVQLDQILEFRKDKSARKKIRNLLLFFHENYENKSYSFIEDDLSKRLDEYYTAVKDWGFETRNSIFSAILDSQCLLATTAATLGAILLNEPIAQTISALAGTTLNVGKILLTYDKQKHAFHKLKRDHDLAYIIEAKEHFELLGHP